MCVSIFAKMAEPEQSYFEANQVTLKVFVVFGKGSSIFQKTFNLRDVSCCLRMGGEIPVCHCVTPIPAAVSLTVTTLPMSVSDVNVSLLVTSLPMSVSDVNVSVCDHSSHVSVRCECDHSSHVSVRCECNNK